MKLLDTDTLSLIMRQNTQVLEQARAYLYEYRYFTLSVITKYEIQRGLRARNASNQLMAFEQFLMKNKVLPIDGVVADKGALIYADLASRGQLIGDADILIAATAMAKGFGVVTKNRKHFDRIKDLQVESW